MKKVQEIEEIRKAFKGEWLLIEVTSVDEKTTTPLAGVLIGHASSPESLWKKAGEMNEEVMVVYSEDWPDDLAACF